MIDWLEGGEIEGGEMGGGKMGGGEIGSTIQTVTYVSRRIQYLFKVSQDAFEWIIQKRLETLWMNIEYVLRRFRMISQSRLKTVWIKTQSVSRRL